MEITQERLLDGLSILLSSVAVKAIGQRQYYDSCS